MEIQCNLFCNVTKWIHKKSDLSETLVSRLKQRHGWSQSCTPKIFSMIYFWSSTTWLPYFFQISYIWPNLSTPSLSCQVLMCKIDTTYWKSQYQSQFLRLKWVLVSTFETKGKSLGVSLNLWHHSKKSQSHSWLSIPTTKRLSLSLNFWDQSIKSWSQSQTLRP